MKKPRLAWSILIITIVLGATACGPAPTNTPPPATQPPTAISPLPTPGGAGEDTMPAVDLRTAPLVQKAVEDLSQRLGLDPQQIRLLSVEDVQWRDSSLGCPKPGMNYLMVITPGHLIRLEAEGQVYEYHTDEKRVIYCENPQPPLQ